MITFVKQFQIHAKICIEYLFIKATAYLRTKSKSSHFFDPSQKRIEIGSLRIKRGCVLIVLMAQVQHQFLETKKVFFHSKRVI